MFFGLEHFIPYFPSKVVYQQLFVVCWWCSRVHRPLFRRPCMAWMELSKLKSWVVDNGDPHIGSTFWSRRNVGANVGVPFQAVHTLIDMGADCWQMNGSGFTALDYARDMETAEFLCAWGFCPVHHFPSIFRSCFAMKVGQYLQNVTWSLSSNMGSRAESHEVASGVWFEGSAQPLATADLCRLERYK